MQLWFWFVIALAPTGVLSLLLWNSQKHSSASLEILNQNQNRQMAMNQTLTNLILSKDPMTFQGLQAMTSPNSSAPYEEVVSPLDDESMAAKLAEQYQRHGLDPHTAYDNETPSFATEFGLDN